LKTAHAAIFSRKPGAKLKSKKARPGDEALIYWNKITLRKNRRNLCVDIISVQPYYAFMKQHWLVDC